MMVMMASPIPSSTRITGSARSFGIMVSAAPINPDILIFFGDLDLIIHEIYGQSEGCGVATVNRRGATKFGSGGLPFTITEVTLAEDGEILVKGDNVFIGYYKDPEATADIMIDGWLHSGDLGVLDNAGYLAITGRHKDVIIVRGHNHHAEDIEHVVERVDGVRGGGSAAFAVWSIGGRRLASAVPTLACSLWWIAGLSMQQRYGLNILEFTETVEAAWPLLLLGVLVLLRRRGRRR